MNKTIGDLVVVILEELNNDISVSVDIDESNIKQLYVQVDDNGLAIPLQSFIFSMSEYDKLLSEVLNHFIPPETSSPLKRFLVITPSSDKPYNMEYMYEGELLANYAEVYDVISGEHKHNKELTNFVEEADLGDVYTIEAKLYDYNKKLNYNNVFTVIRINDNYK